MNYTLAQYYSDSGIKLDMDFAKQVSMKFEPDPHQKTGLNRAIVETKFGLYDECDTGKTCVMQAFSMFYAKLGHPVVGVMLPVLIPQFRESLYETFIGSEDHINVQMYNVPPKKREKMRQQWKDEGLPDILLLSYQMFAKEFRYLKEAGFKVYFADEADMMCNPETLANKAMKEVTADADTPCLPVTGTPNRKELLDCYGLISLTNTAAYQSKGHFERLHVEYFKDPNSKQKVILEYNNKDLLHRNLYAKARRVTKESIGRQEKPRVQIVPVELSPAHLSLYRKLLKERILEVDGEIIDGVTAQALRTIATRLVTTPENYIDSDKKIANHMVDAIDAIFMGADVEEQNKIILFAHYQSTVESLAKRYAHLNPSIMYGKNSSRHGKEKSKFIEDETCRILIANTISAGVGVDGFQKVCSKEIFVEPQATPRNFTQAVERVNRRGQTKTCNISILSAQKTLYPARIDKMLERNAQIKEVNKDKYSFLDELYGKS